MLNVFEVSDKEATIAPIATAKEASAKPEGIVELDLDTLDQVGGGIHGCYSF